MFTIASVIDSTATMCQKAGGPLRAAWPITCATITGPPRFSRTLSRPDAIRVKLVAMARVLSQADAIPAWLHHNTHLLPLPP